MSSDICTLCKGGFQIKKAALSSFSKFCTLFKVGFQTKKAALISFSKICTLCKDGFQKKKAVVSSVATILFVGSGSDKSNAVGNPITHALRYPFLQTSSCTLADGTKYRMQLPALSFIPSEKHLVPPFHTVLITTTIPQHIPFSLFRPNSHSSSWGVCTTAGGESAQP